jgi:hypothetical protein
MPTAEDTLQALYSALAIDQALDYGNPAERKVYVKNLQVGDRMHPVDELLDSISHTDQPGSWLFTGHRGVGKSTELHRMAWELGEQGHLVVMADMAEYVNLGQPINTEALLLSLVAALAEGVGARLGGDRLQESYATRLLNFLRNTQVEFEGLGLDVAAAGNKLSLKAKLKTDPSLISEVHKAIEGSTARLHAKVVGFAKAIAKEVAAHPQFGPKAKVVVLLDSLEKLRVSGTDAQQSYDAIQRTFDVNGEFLKLQHVSVVYSVPPYLPFLTPRIGSYFGVEVAVLPHCKVFETPPEPNSLAAQAAGTALQPARPHTAGLDLLVQCVLERVPAAETVLPRTVLSRLALASSGSVRDYFRLIRTLITKMRVAKVALPLADDSLVLMAEQGLRDEMKLPTDDLKWLRVVRRTHGEGLDKLENLQTLARLFDSGVILNYLNGRRWCEVHYLLHGDLGEPEPVAAA